MLIIVISIIGLLDTLYLISRHLQKKDVHCLFFPDEWCRKVQHSKQSKMFGVPNSYWGFLMYSSILLLGIIHYLGLYDVLYALSAVIGFGFLFSLYFMYVQAVVLRAYCTWCVLSAINFTVLAVTVTLMILS